MATRTQAKKTAARPAQKPSTGTQARKRTAKTTAKKPAPTPATLVDLRKPLPTRRPTCVGPLSTTEQAASRAALASAMARLPIPVLAWHGPTARLADGTRITHTDPRPPAFNTPAQPPEFTAHVPCPHGATHQHRIHSAADLTEARITARACTTAHGTSEHQRALTEGVSPLIPPKIPTVFPLREGIRRANASTAETQPLPLNQIAAGLTERATTAADEQPKEHPAP